MLKESLRQENIPSKITVIEYKDKLFKTQEEYAAFRREELVSQLCYFAGYKAAISFLEILSVNSISTKAKLDQLILDVKKYAECAEETDESNDTYEEPEITLDTKVYEVTDLENY